MTGRLAYLLLVRDDTAAADPVVSKAVHVWLRPDTGSPVVVRDVALRVTAWCANPSLVLIDDETGTILATRMIEKTLRPGDVLSPGAVMLSTV